MKRGAQVDLDSGGGVSGGGGADVDLFEAIRDGDMEWRDLVFRRYERMVRNLMMRELGPRARIDDLVSEVFLRFFEGAARIRSASGLRSYLYAIALHTARDDMRLRQKERGALPTSGSVLCDEVRSHDDPRARAALRHLETILRGMRSSERDAYVLRQVVGLALPDVARALGVSLSTAQRRVRSARQFVEKRAARSALLSEYVRLERAGGPSAAKGPLHAAIERVEERWGAF